MPKPVRVEVYRGVDGRWFWRAKSGNNRVIGASEQGHRSRFYTKRKARRQFPDAEFTDG